MQFEFLTFVTLHEPGESRSSTHIQFQLEQKHGATMMHCGRFMAHATRPANLPQGHGIMGCPSLERCHRQGIHCCEGAMIKAPPLKNIKNQESYGPTKIEDNYAKRSSINQQAHSSIVIKIPRLLCGGPHVLFVGLRNLDMSVGRDR